MQRGDQVKLTDGKWNGLGESLHESKEIANSSSSELVDPPFVHG